jgi:hypothetical protein
LKLGAIPSPNEINDWPPDMEPPPKPDLPPVEAVIDPKDSDIDAMSKTIRRLSALLAGEKRKREHFEKKYKNELKEKQNLRKDIYKQKIKTNKARNKQISKDERWRIVREVLKESTQFTDVRHFCRILETPRY